MGNSDHRIGEDGEADRTVQTHTPALFSAPFYENHATKDLSVPRQADSSSVSTGPND